MTKLVYFKDEEPPEILGRIPTSDEYANITETELLDAIRHSSWATCVLDTDRDFRFTKEVRNMLRAMTAAELKDLIEKHNGLLVHALDDDLEGQMHAVGPWERYEFPIFSKGPRKGYPNFNKDPEEFFDRWYEIEFKDECIVVEKELEEETP
jgi:hypothetical protein